MIRPMKVIRFNYWDLDTKDVNAAAITILKGPEEARISAGPKSFVSVVDGRVTLSGGCPSVINIQGLGDSLRFAGLLQGVPFPLSLLPSTVATPIPQHVFRPPFVDQLPLFLEISAVAASMVV